MTTVRSTRESVEVAGQAPPAVRLTRASIEVARADTPPDPGAQPDPTQPIAQGFGALLGGNLLRLAVASDKSNPLLIYTRDSLASRQDQTGSGGKNVLELGYAFARSNLTGGEGLDWYPRVVGDIPTATDEIRFWDSAGVDIRRPESGEQYTITLSKEFNPTFYTPAASPVDAGASRDAVYVAEGTNVQRFDDWTDATPDNTEVLPASIVSLDVSIDDTVIATLSDGDIFIKPAFSDDFVQCYDEGVDGPAAKAAWWVKGRIIAACIDTTSADYGEVNEIAPVIGGTPAVPTATQVVTTIDTFSGDMNDCVDAGHVILAAFSDGSLRSYVPQTDTAGGVPALTIRGRTQVPNGENPYALGWNIGVLMVLTAAAQVGASTTIARAYTGEVLDERFDYVVGPLQLVRTWLNSVETVPNYVTNIVSTRDEMFFMIGEASSEFNVWRMDLVTQGLFRHNAYSGTAGDGLLIFDERLAFAEGANLVLESDTDFVPTGYVITPLDTEGLNTPINWTTFVLDTLNLDTEGVMVELAVSTDPASILDPNHAGWRLVETYTDPAQSGLERSVGNVQGNQATLQIKLTRSTTKLVAPNVRRFAMRGFPKHRDWVADVPVNISDIVSAPGRMPLHIPGHGDKEHRKILALQGETTTLEIFHPPTVIRGFVEKIHEPVTYLTDRGSPGVMCLVRVLGNLVDVAGTGGAGEQGNAGMGVMYMGIGTMGIGEVT